MHTLIGEAKDSKKALINWRRTLHKNPELSFQEYETSAFIQQELAAMDIPFRVLAETGIVAHVGSGERCVALRADIDALPIHEEADVPFASQNPGVMHACGHDAHTAMLLGAAQILKKREASLGGVVKLIFQPGEEKVPGGASMMIREGVLENPTPEVIFGQHVNPAAPVGNASFVAGRMMASADELYWTIQGKSGHAAQPDTAIDPIVVAAHLITQLQTIVSRTLNPFEPGVLSVTSIHGGTVTNIIPDTVEMKGTLRSMNLEWRERAIANIENYSRTLAATMGATCDVTVLRGYPPLINDEAATAFARDAASSLLGEGSVTPFEPKMWGEDFAFYAQTIPACFWMLGIRSPERDETPGLHNCKFVIDEEALPIGTALMANAALTRLAQ